VPLRKSYLQPPANFSDRNSSKSRSVGYGISPSICGQVHACAPALMKPLQCLNAIKSDWRHFRGPWDPLASASKLRTSKVLKLASLPTLTHCFRRNFTLITRTAPCLRQLSQLRCRLPARFPIATCSIRSGVPAPMTRCFPRN